MLRKLAVLAMGLGLGTTALSPVAAETYPSKPLKMYIGFSAGSATDIVGRVVADALGKKLGQPIVVENKVGAGGSLAAQDTARAPSDGYTLLTVSSAIAVNPAVYKNADAVLQELEPVALIGYLPTVLMASDKMPVNNMEEFIKYAKDHPTEVNFGSSGVGGSTHMAMEAFGRIADIKMTHIPFKGNAQASAALLGSQIDAMMETILLATPVINGKRAKGLAISGEQRSSLIPDVPTFAEAGVPEYNRSLFFGVMAPAGISPDLVQKLNTEINAVLQDPAVRERLVQTGGVDVANLSSDEFKGLVKDEVALWKSIAADVGITPQ